MPESSSQDRPLAVRRRRDLVIAQTGTATAPRWTVKDPLSLRYFQLREADYFVFSQLNGDVTLAEIQRRYHRQYAPRKLAAATVLAFVQRLWSQGLVTVDQFGASESLFRRQQLVAGQRLSQGLASLLAIRFRGIDPDGILSALLPVLGWFFSIPMLLITIGLMAFSGGLVLAEWDRLLSDLPTFRSMLSFNQAGVFVAVFVAVKILHELGHGLVCKKLGGECRELGVMLLALTPCLYCNVSDAWLLRNRWHRAAIGAAGIDVELVLASVCTLLWHSSRPGLFHSVCLDVMLICSVNTLLLNGNPLLRYDGYYVLADLIDVPNLRPRSQQLLRNAIYRVWFGQRFDAGENQSAATQFGFLAFGLASAIYTWIVVFAILWMFYQVAKGYGLEVIVVGFGVILLLNRVWRPCSQLLRTARHLAKEGQLRLFRFLLVTLLLFSGVLGCLRIPVDRQVTAPLLVRPAEETLVFVTVPGRIRRGFDSPSGKTVSEGQILVELENLEITQALKRLAGDVDRQRKKLESLEIRRGESPDAANQIPVAQSMLVDLTRRLQSREEEAARLTIRSPLSGTLLSGKVTRSDDRFSPTPDLEFALFSTPLPDLWLEAGTELCRIVSPTSREAVMYVDQAEATAIDPGDRVTLTVMQGAGDVMRGTVVEVASEPISTVPPVLAALGEVEVAIDSEGGVRPITPIHEVRVRCDAASETGVPIVLGQIGRGTIALGRETLGDRLLRFLRRTFTFDL
ncbi:MAG: HlyD family efflux transporter periplasmic adaptor subunit [Planctomycetaceae bacterium]|nr:HlyD family efflux transporter periplasmic adaptor subunit [Planctomycetaceae bacterium]